MSVACGSGTPDTTPAAIGKAVYGSGPERPVASDRLPPPPPADPSAAAPDATVEVRPASDGLVRGVWVHLFDDALKSRASIVELVDEVAAAGGNTIFAQVARRHDAYYTSTVLPRTPDPTLEPGLDVLAVLLDAARPHGIEVHAWITVAPTWHETYRDLGAPSGWLATAHGVEAPEADRWVTRSIDGTWSDYLDPALPEVGEHVAEVLAELARGYAIAGVHLDYVRYPSERHGYHPRVLERYRSETGATGTPAPDDPQFSAWRRAQGAALVARARQALAEVAPDVELSAAVVTWGAGPSATPGGFDATRTATEALQDWPSWVEDGLVDAVMPMNYFREHDPVQAAWLRQWLAFEQGLADAHDVRIVPGIAGWLNQPEGSHAQARLAAAHGDGVVLYSYQQPSADGSREVLALLGRLEAG